MSELAELAKRLRAHAQRIFELCGEDTEESRDLLAAAEIMQRSDWRPISEAPHNGMAIEVLYAPSGRSRAARWDEESQGWLLVSAWDVYYRGDYFTHWRPLPAPPEVKP